MRRYLISTGYVRNAKTPVPAGTFFDSWIKNTLANSNPVKVFVACAGGASPTWSNGDVQFHRCSGDLGHIRDKHEGRNSYPFTGWAGGMMLGAMAAYNECCDFIYKEQDCLAFGDWANQLYKDAGMRPAVLGRGLMPPHSQLKSSQSLFMVKHGYIPSFIVHYISMGEDFAAGPTTGENKFRRMIEMYPSMYAVQSGWNLDRDRTTSFQKLKEKGEPWAIQQVTPQEFEVIQSLNLI